MNRKSILAGAAGTAMVAASLWGAATVVAEPEPSLKIRQDAPTIVEPQTSVVMGESIEVLEPEMVDVAPVIEYAEPEEEHDDAEYDEEYEEEEEYEGHEEEDNDEYEDDDDEY